MPVKENSAKVYSFLQKNNAGFPKLLKFDESADNPYFDLGSHPEVVERLWDEINPKLPVDCRYIIYGTPVLINIETGMVPAIAIGTVYAFRVPPTLRETVINSGFDTQIKWSDGDKETEVKIELGDEWFIGSWSEAEIDWIKESYAEV